MTIQSTESQVMTEREASQLTEKIRITAHNYADARQKLTEYVAQAKAGSAHVVLGFESWQAYLAATLGDEPMRVARSERPDMARMLTEEGMSTRAVAAVMGIDPKTVRNDLQSTGEYSPVDEPRISHGLDGKTRTHQPAIRNDPKPEPSAPRAEPVAAQFTAAIVELNKIMARLHRISENPNFTKNKNQIATLHGSDLARTISELETLADSLN